MSKRLSKDAHVLYLEQLGVAISDRVTMTGFYTQILGMQTLIDSSEQSLFIGRLHNLKLVAFSTPNPLQAPARSIPQFMSNPPGYDHLVFEVDDIAAMQRQFERQGVMFEVVMELELPEGGLAKVARFKDPEGNLIGLQQRVDATSATTAASIVKLDNIGVAVRDAATMFDFYTQVLEMQAAPLPPGAGFFIAQLGDVKFAVFQTSSPNFEHKRAVEDFRSNPPGYDHLLFAVDDLDAMLARLEQKNLSVAVIEEIRLPDGHRAKVARFKDPEGNLIGLQQILE